jgi:hypothetical protein
MRLVVVFQLVLLVPYVGVVDQERDRWEYNAPFYGSE